MLHQKQVLSSIELYEQVLETGQAEHCLTGSYIYTACNSTESDKACTIDCSNSYKQQTIDIHFKPCMFTD